MAKKKKTMIGVDPLAWLKDEAEDAEIIEEEKAVSKKKSKKKTAAKKTAAKKSAKAKKTKESGNEVVFKIQAVQDISSVANVHSELKKLLSNEKVIIEADQVERIDAASLQLFYSFIEQAKENNVTVAWRSPSDVLRNNAKQLGMEEALQLNNAA